MSAAITTQERRVPPLGGFNPTFIALEIRRILRNRRTLIFVLIMPIFLLCVLALPNKDQQFGDINAMTYYVIAIGTYSAMVAATAGGAAVSVERAQGWSRQLRLTPLAPVAYIMMKIVAAMVLSAVSVIVVYLIGFALGSRESMAIMVSSAVITWIGALVFAAFGLFMGYLLPSENVMQFLGFILAILAFFGGIWVPLQQFPQLLQDISKFFPSYGMAQLAQGPLAGAGLNTEALANFILWLIIFGGGAALLYRRDTARV